MNVKFPGEDGRTIAGTYQFLKEFNGRNAYKHISRNLFFFFIEGNEITGNSRWVIEQSMDPQSKYWTLHGYIRYENDVSCPENVGKQWANVWKDGAIDQNIEVQCSKGMFIFYNALAKLTFIFVLYWLSISTDWILFSFYRGML